VKRLDLHQEKGVINSQLLKSPDFHLTNALPVKNKLKIPNPKEND
jgi:hypothetical protein